MSDAAIPADMPADLDDAAYQRALAVLLRVGTALAQQLEAPADTVSVTDRATAFDRVALAVRRTIILSRHIREHAVATSAAHRANARRDIIRAVEDKIEAKAPPAEAPNLRVELLERLDAPEFDLDLAHLSPAAVITHLCRDLGLANIPHTSPFPRRTPADIARLCAQAAAATGSGLSHRRTAAHPGPS